MAHSSLTNVIYAEGPVSEPRFAFANAAAAGDTTLVAAAGAGKKIRVIDIVMSPTAASDCTFKSNATAISALFTLGIATPITFANPCGLFETAANEPLQVTVGAAITGVQVVYVVIG